MAWIYRKMPLCQWKAVPLFVEEGWGLLSSSLLQLPFPPCPARLRGVSSPLGTTSEWGGEQEEVGTQNRLGLNSATGMECRFPNSNYCSLSNLPNSAVGNWEIVRSRFGEVWATAVEWRNVQISSHEWKSPSLAQGLFRISPTLYALKMHFSPNIEIVAMYNTLGRWKKIT